MTDNTTQNSETALFNAAVSMRHEEATLIWQRYIAMLLANTLILNAFLQPGAKKYSSALLLLGSLTSIVWLLLTRLGWNILERKIRIEEALAEKLSGGKGYSELHQQSYNTRFPGFVVDGVQALALLLALGFLTLYGWLWFS